MAEKPEAKRRRWKRHLWWIVPLVLVVYVMSLGPMADCCSHTPPDSLPRRAFVIFYRPVTFVMVHAPTPVSNAILWLATLIPGPSP
jgi:hypothetical protein